MKRVQRKRTKGFNLQKASRSGLPVKYVGRPTKWGNPYKAGKHYIPIGEILLNPFNPKWEMCKSVEHSIELYKEHLQRELKYGRLSLDELRGYDLACFCPLEKDCHVDVLIELLE